MIPLSWGPPAFSTGGHSRIVVFKIFNRIRTKDLDLQFSQVDITNRMTQSNDNREAKSIEPIVIAPSIYDALNCSISMTKTKDCQRRTIPELKHLINIRLQT